MSDRTARYRQLYEGTVWCSNNYGDFIISDYVDSDNVIVRFIVTGYEVNTSMLQIRKGSVKDKFAPRVYGVGYTGEGVYAPTINRRATKAYDRWLGMLQRCYCSKYLKTRPNYKGCSVAEEWHNFQNFAEWFEEHYIEGYDLDKDIKIEGNKIYGPDTCMFVTPQENSEKAQAKYYKVVNPEGEVVSGYNMAKLCRKFGLAKAHMTSVMKGERNHHKGWTKYE